MPKLDMKSRNNDKKYPFGSDDTIHLSSGGERQICSNHQLCQQQSFPSLSFCSSVSYKQKHFCSFAFDFKKGILNNPHVL